MVQAYKAEPNLQATAVSNVSNLKKGKVIRICSHSSHSNLEILKREFVFPKVFLKSIKYFTTKPDGCRWQKVYVVLFYASYSIMMAVLAARNNILNTVGISLSFCHSCRRHRTVDRPRLIQTPPGMLKANYHSTRYQISGKLAKAIYCKKLKKAGMFQDQWQVYTNLDQQQRASYDSCRARNIIKKLIKIWARWLNGVPE